MTNGERKKTCSYHWVTFLTDKDFTEHFRYCSSRVQYGYVDLDNLGCA